MANIDQARLRAVLTWPYAASAVFRLVPIASDKVPTMAVDPLWRLYYSPTYLESLSVQDAAGVILHEVGHLVRRHHKRARPIGVTDFEEWNSATDAEINGSYLDEGIKLPGDCVTPERLGLERGHIAETYYRQLMDAKEKEEEQDDDENGQGSGDAGDQGDSGAGGEDPPKESQGHQDGDNGDGAGNGEGSTDDAQEGHGANGTPTTGSSGADGIPRPWDLPAPECGGPESVSDAEAKSIAANMARRILESSKQHGTGAGGWRGWADEIVNPRVDWRRELRSIARRSATVAAGETAWSYRRPGRRMREGILTPSRMSPRIRVDVVIDTSGSISDRGLAEALAEVVKLTRTITSADLVRVIAADDDAGTVQRFRRRELVEITGRGGTDMRKPIRHAASLKPAADVILVITDGYTPWPDEPLAVECIAVILPNGADYLVPDWMRRVVMN